MEVIINKDITKYKIERWKGLSARQIIVGIGLLVSVIGGILFFFFVCKVPLLISSIMITPVAFSLVLFGFYEPDGMSFWTYLKKQWNTKLLVYCSIREEEQGDIEMAPVNRLQRLCISAKQMYGQISKSKLGIRIIQVLVLGRTAADYVYRIIRHAIRLFRTVSEKIKQARANKEKSRKEKGEKAE